MQKSLVANVGNQSAVVDIKEVLMCLVDIWGRESATGRIGSLLVHGPVAHGVGNPESKSTFPQIFVR